MDLFKNNEYILVKLANVDIDDEASILAFCNEYGLPYSSAKISDEQPGYYIMGLDVDEHTYAGWYPLYRQDSMQVYEFKRHVFSARRILNVKNEIQSPDKNYINLFKYLLPMLLYERRNFYDFDSDDPERITDTMEFQYYYLSVLNKRTGGKPSSFGKDLWSFIIEVQSIERKKNKVYITDELRDLFQRRYPNDLYRFLFDIARYDIDQMMQVEVDEFAEFQLPTDFYISDETKKHMDVLASRILSDNISELLQKVHPKMTVGEDGNISSQWDLKYLNEGILLETLVMTSSETRLKKCANPTCGKFFTPNPGRYDKIYCSHACGSIVAKRRQRLRDKEDPNRERMEPGFKNRKSD